jgi:ribosomal protein S18 acetylase RimI-like enzyme
MKIRPFHETDTEAVVRLWEHCGLTRPWNNPHKDIERKLTTQRELFLVGELDGGVIGSVMAGYDGHRGWVNYLAIAPEHQRKDYGRQLMEQVESQLRERGCPKLNLQVRTSNEWAVGFYARLGYVQDQVVSLGKRLISDESEA